MIALPLRTKKELAVDFAHAAYLCIYDEMTSRSEIFEISQHDAHQSPDHVFEKIMTRGVTTIISQYYSYMALRVFKEYGMDTLKAKGVTLHENLEHFQQHQLQNFEVYETIRSKDCGKQCQSCGTSSCS